MTEYTETIESSTNGIGNTTDPIDEVYDSIDSEILLELPGIEFGVDVRVKVSGSNNDYTFDAVKLIPLTVFSLDSLESNMPFTTNGYVDGYLMPITGRVFHLDGREFPNATIILEGLNNKVLSKSDYRGIVFDWVDFDTYSSAIFFSNKNVIHSLVKTEISGSIYDWTVRKDTITNVKYRMIHHNRE